MVKSQIVALSCLVSLIEMLAPGTGMSAQPPKLSGTFRLVAEQSDDINRAIEGAVARMSFVMRPFARSRLRTINTPYPRLVIESTADAIVVVADPRAPVRTPANGAPIRWRREDGETFNVSGTWEGPAFQQTFVSGTGHRVNRYIVSPDGQTLTVQVEITGGGLKGPMTYHLVYRRIA
ncbi:MAG: hypothetical protein ACHQ4J_07390 [Candidatus Binatia bacterium]